MRNFVLLICVCFMASQWALGEEFGNEEKALGLLRLGSAHMQDQAKRGFMGGDQNWQDNHWNNGNNWQQNNQWNNGNNWQHGNQWGGNWQNQWANNWEHHDGNYYDQQHFGFYQAATWDRMANQLQWEIDRRRDCDDIPNLLPTAYYPTAYNPIPYYNYNTNIYNPVLNYNPYIPAPYNPVPVYNGITSFVPAPAYEPSYVPYVETYRGVGPSPYVPIQIPVVGEGIIDLRVLP